MTALADTPQLAADSVATPRRRGAPRTPAPRVAAAATVFPPHRYHQEELTRAFRDVVLGDRADSATEALLERLHGAAGVRSRALALPLEAYADLGDFGATNDTYLEVATEMGERAVASALRQAGLQPSDVDTLMTVSITGLGAPGVDARLVSRLGLRPDVRRVPVFGLGCVAGAAGLARVADLMRGDPDGVAVLLAVELCSLTLQRDDISVPNLVASGLFGDGAAAVVVVGERRAREMGCTGAAVVATRSCFYPNTEHLMGWHIGASGFRIQLAATVADVVEEHVGADIHAFLADHQLAVDDVDHWISHPGGPRILRALQAELSLPPSALDHTWASLAESGNLSSVSVLDVLARTVDSGPPPHRSWGLALAMGPGFCAELVLLRW